MECSLSIKSVDIKQIKKRTCGVGNVILITWDDRFYLHVYEKSVSLYLIQVTVADFWLSYLNPLVFSQPQIFFLNNLVFKCFDFERTWWRLIKKLVVCTKFVIYVFIISRESQQIFECYYISKNVLFTYHFCNHLSSDISFHHSVALLWLSLFSVRRLSDSMDPIHPN